MSKLRSYRVLLEHETRHFDFDQPRAFQAIERIEVAIEAGDGDEAAKMAREPLANPEKWKVRCIMLD